MISSCVMPLTVSDNNLYNITSASDALVHHMLIVRIQHVTALSDVISVGLDQDKESNAGKIWIGYQTYTSVLG